MPLGYGSPIVTIQDSLGKVLPVKVSSYDYVYTNTAGDNSTIVLEADSSALLDLPELQQDMVILVQWGYIQGPVSPRRKLYIMDRDDVLNESGVSLTLRCGPKAEYLRSKTTNAVYEGQNTTELAKNITDSMGIDNTETPEDTTTSFGQTGYLNRERALSQESGFNSSARNTTATVKPGDINYESFPTAGKTNMQVLTELAAAKPGGPNVMIAKDDSLVIKQAELNGEPIRSWTYKGEGGEVISFKYSSDARNTRGTASNLEVKTWDAVNKKFVVTSMDATNDPTTKLADATNYETPAAIAAAQAAGIDLDYIDEEDAEIISRGVDSVAATRVAPTFNPQAATPKNTFNLKTKNKDYVATELDTYKHGFTETQGFNTAGTESTAMVGGESKFILGISLISEEDSPEAAAEKSANKLAESNLNSHTAVLTVILDPSIESDKIISIFNVGLKNSGNWYISKAKHSVIPASGAILTMDLLRGQMAAPVAKNEDGSINSQASSKLNTDGTVSIPETWEG